MSDKVMLGMAEVNGANESNYPKTKGIRELRKIDPGTPKDLLKWGVYNEPISSYEETFQPVLNGMTISQLLTERNEPVVVVDLMAPTGTLATLFEQMPNTRKKGIAVGLSDTRAFGTDKLERDASLNISYVATIPDFENDQAPSLKGEVGDISTNITWDKLDEVLAGEKADLIMERAVGGLLTLPHLELFYKTMLQRVWDRLKPDGGIFLAQTLTQEDYKKLGLDFGKWLAMARKSGIDIQHNESEGVWDPGRNRRFGTMKMTRHINSPAQLPSDEDL